MAEANKTNTKDSDSNFLKRRLQAGREHNNHMNEGQHQPPHGGGGGRRRRRRHGGGKQQNRGTGQPMGGGQGQGGGQGHGQGQSQGGGQFGQGGGGGRNTRRNRSNRRGGGGQPFVGPMDHSYRQNQGEGNGNFSGRQQGRYGGPQQHFNAPMVDPLPPVKEDAATRIFAFIEDLFFLTKMQDT